ncbi:MAG: 23S rRNA (pseudouridine(1915)-N(3))-methyltransferase RlmH [Alphaproteobacteria bacterium]|nr:23S rRNA (pseudouridine(1915)-N(3))-methyltransferase RlmH [Alphaproteobacteria bacterium]
MKIEILAIGRLRKGPAYDLAADYQGRIQWPVSVRELESKHSDSKLAQKDEQQKLLEAFSPGAYVIALDERGKSLPSPELAQKIEDLRLHSTSLVQFVIGGATGLGPDIRKRADFLLSFGAMTWPHMLARVMLLEQIYRCQQIINRHPYHKE